MSAPTSSRPRKLVRAAAALLTLAALVAGTLPLVASSAGADPVPPSPSASAVFDPGGGGMTGYRIHDLAGGGDHGPIDVVGIGDDGRVAGNETEDGHTVGWTWRLDQGGIQRLESTALATTVGAVSSDGAIAGTALGTGPGAGKLLWVETDDGSIGAPQLVAPSGSGFLSDVNARHEVLVNTTVFGADGSSRVLPSLYPTPQPANGSYATAIAFVLNDQGVAAGVSSTDQDGIDGAEPPREEVTIWTGTQPRGVGQMPVAGVTSVTAINEHGDIVVRVTEGIDTDHAFLVANGKLTPIHGPEGFENVQVTAMDEDGGVLATGSGDGGLHTFLWRDGHILDLNTLITDPAWTAFRGIDMNDDGQIVGLGEHDGVTVPVLLDPVDPVVFIHGAGASRLSTVTGGEEDDNLWMDCGESRDQLSLFPEDEVNPTIRATDAMRFETCYRANRWVNPGLDIYGTLLQRLTSNGTYREYLVEGRPERFTSAGCDVSQDERHPNLFVFAYDWRRDNAESADRLADFMTCVARFWPNHDVDLLTHSMGSLVARRYVLDHPESVIDRVVTIGAPWLGAPKLVNVLYTGDFAPPPANGDPATIRRIVSGFPAAHELMASELYQDSSGPPVMVEDGWDVDGDGEIFEDHTHSEMRALVDGFYPRTTPATTARRFQLYGTPSGDQTDWRTDATGVDWVHIVGLQAGQNTVGQVVFQRRLACDEEGRCAMRNSVTQRLVCGDGTVPLSSASRVTPAGDFNAPGADVRLYPSTQNIEDHWVEHTGLAANLEVDHDIFDLLTTGDDLKPSDRFPFNSASPNTDTCLRGTQTLAAGGGAVPLTHQRRYIDLFGGTDVVVADGTGSTEPTGPTGGYVAGVTMFPSDRPDAGLVTVPVAVDRSYTIDFTGTGDPVALEVLQGTQTDPVEAIRWTDAVVPSGARARLSLTATGSEVLRVDLDGDGAFEQEVPATKRLAGADAADVSSPEVVVTATETGSEKLHAITATDSGSGVARVMWSSDGTHFEVYDAPIEVPAGATVLHAVAEDRAGNRSAPVTVELADVPVTALTTGVLTPAPGDTGWNAGATSVDLRATPSGDAEVQAIEWRLEGATQQDTTRTDGDHVAIDIDAVGTTVVHFRSISSGGIAEPERVLVVRIDTGDPAVQVLDPLDGAVVTELASISGTATDDASGVAAVELSIRNGDGEWWDGESWSSSEDWLGTAGASSWRLVRGLPSGADLPIGAYRLQARVADEAGHEVASAVHRMTVAPEAGASVVELRSPVTDSTFTSAAALNDRGVAVGATGRGSGARATRWVGGRQELLELPAPYSTSSARAVDDSGIIVGTVGTGTGGAGALWLPDGEIQVLPALDGAAVSEANGLARGGEIVVGASGPMPVRWDGGAPTALPVLPGMIFGRAWAVNDAGTIVGELLLGDGLHAVRWEGDAVVDLGNLGGHDASARAISALGTIVGQASDGNQVSHAVVFGVDGPAAIDGGLSAASSVALGVNAAGVVVGSSTDRRGSSLAFKWTSAAGVQALTTDPTTSDWTLNEARAVNSFGQVVGAGRIAGRTAGFVVSASHAPVAPDLSVSTDGEPLAIDLPGFDPDPTDAVTVEVLDGPEHGTLSDTAGLATTYAPDRRFEGTDTFTYRLDDGRFSSDVGTVTIDVAGGGVVENDPPTAHISGPSTVIEGAPVTFDASGSSDADGTVESVRWDLDGDGPSTTETAPKRSCRPPTTPRWWCARRSPTTRARLPSPRPRSWSRTSCP